MAEADRDDIPPGYEWVSLNVYVERKARTLFPTGFPCSPQYALGVVCRELEEGKLPVRSRDADDHPCPAGEYQGADGRTYQTRLPGFWMEADFDLATSSATQLAKTYRVPNPYYYGGARADCPAPKVTWISDPRSHSAYIEQTAPAVTIRNIEVLIPCVKEMSAVAPVAAQPHEFAQSLQGSLEPSRASPRLLDPTEWLKNKHQVATQEGSIPTGWGAKKAYSEQLETQMDRDYRDKKVLRALSAGRIANLLSELGLWSG